MIFGGLIRGGVLKRVDRLYGNYLPAPGGRVDTTLDSSGTREMNIGEKSI